MPKLPLRAFKTYETCVVDVLLNEGLHVAAFSKVSTADNFATLFTLALVEDHATRAFMAWDTSIISLMNHSLVAKS